MVRRKRVRETAGGIAAVSGLFGVFGFAGGAEAGSAEPPLVIAGFVSCVFLLGLAAILLNREDSDETM